MIDDSQPERPTQRLDREPVSERRCLRCDSPLSPGTISAEALPGKLINMAEPEHQLRVSVWLGKNWLGVPRIARELRRARLHPLRLRRACG